MEHELKVPCEHEAQPEKARAYLAVRGQADSTPKFVGRLVTAAWVRRIVYNATIDPHVAFADGVAYRLAKARAEHLDRDEPPGPVRSDTFLPVPRSLDLHLVLTQLRLEHEELRRWPATMLRLVIDEGCRARKRHVQDCADAKAAGIKLPRLHYRSVADDLDVSTENFRILRCGDGPAATAPKRGRKSRVAARDRRKEAVRTAADLDWAERRRAAGMWEQRVLAGLRERAERRERSRIANVECKSGQVKVGRNAALPRRDSPSATIGENRVRIEVQGLGRIRVRLSRPIPEGAKIVQVHFVKESGHTNRVQVRLVLDVPAVGPTFDELETGAAIHAVIRELPSDASPLDAVTAVEAAGIKVRGDDWNVSSPSADHTGRTTKRVSVSKAEVVKARRLQRRLAHKDRLLLKARAEAISKPIETGAEQARPKARKRPPKRSRSAQRIKAQIQRKARKLANRATTRACQDAKLLSKNVVLVASDPQRMAKPLLAKGGPAERRANAAAGLPATVPAPMQPPRGYQLTPAQQRAQRRNMHMARPGYRVRRLALLCGTAGVIHATPGHEGTTKTCPKCEAVEAKDLSQRIHDCPRCGLRMPRDQASAIVTLGRALLEFRAGPDPGGRVAELRAAAAEAAEKAARLRVVRVEAGRKTGRARTARARSFKAGATPADGASAPSLQGDVPLCLRRPGRNIGRVPEAVHLRNSN